MIESRVIAPNMTTHAQRRWAERCPDPHLLSEWVNARRVSKKVRKRIPNSYRQKTSDNGRYYLRSPHGAIFVVAGKVPKSVVITVLHEDSLEPRS